MSVFLLFYWFYAAPNDHLQTMVLVGVYESRQDCERHEEFFKSDLAAKAELSCVQRYIEK